MNQCFKLFTINLLIYIILLSVHTSQGSCKGNDFLHILNNNDGAIYSCAFSDEGKLLSFSITKNEHIEVYSALYVDYDVYGTIIEQLAKIYHNNFLNN